MNRQIVDSHSQPNLAPEMIATAPLAVSDIQDWLALQVSEQLGIDADEVDIDTPLSRYGLESVQAMAIAEAGKQRFGLEISPLVIWNYPTIVSLSDYIDQVFNGDESESFEL